MSEILVAGTNSESGSEARDFEDYLQEEEEEETSHCGKVQPAQGLR